MTAWLIDTFLYTGALILGVLLLRQPVSRHFGPQVAYALWALPLLRFLMPPIVLPASLAPSEAQAVAEPLVVVLSEASAEAAATATSAPVPEVSIQLMDLLLPLWLGGAAIFLIWRAREYVLMRRDLLAGARPVGEAGKVRLVETPMVASPVAFGISDKVVALPPEFMAHHDIAARDMAIAHELAHHRGLDLVANVAAQPLLALHWFNPLAWWGWRAMRRDQEAACDARVVAGRERSERAVYAQVIAGFAAGPHLAMAAPMACPVLGEKSIIHRLRSLTMSEIPTGRRKLGIAAIATTALVALPLTASISYAQPEAPEAPVAPVAPEAPVPPAPPAPPSIESIDPDGVHRVIRIEVEDDGEGGEGERRVVRRVIRTHGVDGEEFDEAEIERMMAEMEAEMAGHEMANVEVEIRMAMEEAHAAMAESRHAIEESRHAVAEARRNMPRVEMGCEGEDVVRHETLDDGRRVMVICQTAAHNQAASALRQAMAAIRASEDMPAADRERVLRELEREVDRMERREISMTVTPPRAPAAPQAPKAPRAPSVRIEANFNAPQAPVAVQATRVTWSVTAPVRVEAVETRDADEVAPVRVTA